jgi:hypothetical protein
LSRADAARMQQLLARLQDMEEHAEFGEVRVVDTG